MSAYSNPPSSPWRSNNHDGQIEREEVFSRKADIFSARRDYPTPNPSSSIGRASSPVRSNVFRSVTPEVEGEGITNIDPEAAVVRASLDPSKDSISIGRSSRSCDVILNAKDRTVSRTHMLVQYSESSESMTIRCLGFNGLGVVYPGACEVYGTNNKDEYQLVETRQPLKEVDLLKSGFKHTSRTIKLESDRTEFTVNRGETVIVPRAHNIIIEIRNHLILLNPSNDEITDDEYELEPMSEVVRSSSHPPSYESPAKIDLGLRFSSEKPSFEIYSDAVKEEANNISPTVTEDYKVNLPAPKSDKSLSNSTNILNAHQRRRAASQEISKHSKKKKLKSATEVTIDQKCIESLDNINEINNVLVNHLAFSRLSSTPVSDLKGISARTNALSMNQLRTLLHNLESVGIIYREGKDAAGKPLEEEYYYMPEHDDDPDRPALVERIKGHGGLRSCRKTHKQYYWKRPAPIKK